MEVDQIIQYLLIGNLTTDKVIFEMLNSKDAKTIYDINQIFNTYSKKRHHRPESTKIESYSIMITVERIIMILKTDDTFPFDQNFELFKKIKNKVPELSELNWSLALQRQDLKEKISNAIDEFFTEYNNNLQKVMNTISFRNNRSKINNIYTNNYYNEEEMNMKNRNSLISNNRSFDGEKYSFNQLIQEKGNSSNNDKNSLNNKNRLRSKRISVKMIDENNEQDKTNVSKSLIQSSLLVKNQNKLQTSQIPNSLLRELENIIWHITCCKKFILFFLIIIIIAQIIAIPIIIYCSYSY